MKRLALAAATLAAGLALAACSSGGGDLVDSYNRGDAGGGYISGDGQLVTIAESERQPVDAFAGELDTGGSLSSEELQGQVVLLNFWYANCPPCRKEAPDLQALNERYADQGVAFVGVNVEDSADRARTFAEEYDITYPSILDQAENQVQLAFSGAVPPNAVPTTLILDREGRVAARFSGLISDPDLVATILDDTLAEGS